MEIRKTPTYLFKQYPSVMDKKKEKYELYEGNKIISRVGTLREARLKLKRVGEM